MKLINKKAINEKISGKGLKICIVFSTFNDVIGGQLLTNTIEALVQSGVCGKNIEIIKVPGALEIPFTVKNCTKLKLFHAVITLGIVIKGDTPHFDLVANESYRGIMQLNLTSNTPIIFGIITANNKKQATDRALRQKLNKGAEFAETAIKMANLVKFINRKT
jgi:6,7-dimethyl-8-ribityllumazine synthase